MNPKTRSVISTVWLDGNPIFSLSYDDFQRPVYMDLSGFRPDPLDYLVQGERYPAILLFNEELDYQGKTRWVLRSVSVDISQGKRSQSQKFVYIR